MTREFIMMPEFDLQWQKLGLGDTELRQLQEVLLKNPKQESLFGEPPNLPVRGLRKIRTAFEGQDKRGSGRVAYVDFAAHEVVYLITAYP